MTTPSDKLDDALNLARIVVQFHQPNAEYEPEVVRKIAQSLLDANAPLPEIQQRKQAELPPWEIIRRESGDCLWECQECKAHVWRGSFPTAWGHALTCSHHPTGKPTEPVSATQRIEPERVAEALKVKKHEWENADPELLEPWYSHWVQQLTEQGLHSKADIATVLAILSQHAEDSAHDSLRLHQDKMALIDEKIAARSTIGTSNK